MSINVGDKVRVEFKEEDGAVEGRVTHLYGDGDFEVFEHLIFAGSNPLVYNITVLEKKEVEVGDVVKGRDLGKLEDGTVVRDEETFSISWIASAGNDRIARSGYKFMNTERWANVDFTVLFISPEEV